jgi:hypothetical protein
MSTAKTLEHLATKRKVFGFETELGTVFFRGLTGDQLGDFIARFEARDSDFLNFSDQHVIAIAVCNADGSAAFASTEDALAALKQVDISIVKAWVAEIWRCSDLRPLLSVPTTPSPTSSTNSNH